MNKILLFLAMLFFALTDANAQQFIQQYGSITPTHLGVWATNGVLQDAGTPNSPGVSTLGILSQNQFPFCVTSAQAPNPFYQLCLGVVPGSGGYISFNGYGGAPPLPLLCDINNVTAPCLGGGGGGVGNVVATGPATVNFCFISNGVAAPYGAVIQVCPSAAAGGTNLQTQFNCGGLFCGYTPSGDVTVNTATGAETVITCNSTTLGKCRGDNSTITMAAGVLTAATATSSTLGIVKPDNTTITISGGVLSTAGGGAVAGQTVAPGGRFSMQANTPIQGNFANFTNVLYYVSYANNYIPIYNGTTFVPFLIGPLVTSQLALTLTAANNQTGNLYDVYAVNNSGSAVICTGPPWQATNLASTNTRGTAAAITIINGFWVNANSLSHCYNGASDYGTIASSQGSYLGTIYMPAASTTLNGNISNSTTTVATNNACTSTGFQCFPQVGNYYILIDSEAMQVIGGQSTTSLTVARGVLGTTPVSHSSGAGVTMLGGQVGCQLWGNVGAGPNPLSTGGMAPQCDYYNAYNKIRMQMFSVDGKSTINVSGYGPYDQTTNNIIFVDGLGDVYYRGTAAAGLVGSSATYGLWMISDGGYFSAPVETATGYSPSSTTPQSLVVNQYWGPTLGAEFIAPIMGGAGTTPQITGNFIPSFGVGGPSNLYPTYTMLDFNF